MKCKQKIKLKIIKAPRKPTINERIVKTLPKRPIVFKKPAKKPIIKPIC
jgi:hypothetical protein